MLLKRTFGLAATGETWTNVDVEKVQMDFSEILARVSADSGQEGASLSLSLLLSAFFLSSFGETPIRHQGGK